MMSTTASSRTTGPGAPAPTPAPSAYCSEPVGRACMIHRWDNLTFLHWSYEPELIQRLLPSGYTVSCFDGSAWSEMVP